MRRNAPCPDAAPGAPASKRLFFIGGMPKSGTTWLQILLDQHPDISCEGEGHLIGSFSNDLVQAVLKHNALLDEKNTAIFNEKAGYPLFSPADIEQLIHDAVLRLVTKQRKFQTAQVVGEKTPDNILNVPLIWRLFPEARILHLIRDGRDCAVSGWFHNLRAAPQWLSRNYPSMEAYIQQMAALWVRHMEAGERAAAARPDSYCAIRYEDLLDEPRAVLERVLAFLGVPADPAVVETCLEAADFSRLSGGRARGEEDRSSFYRRGAAGDWRNHFTDTSTEAFVAQAGPWLDRLGYR